MPCACFWVGAKNIICFWLVVFCFGEITPLLETAEEGILVQLLKFGTLFLPLLCEKVVAGALTFLTAVTWRPPPL